MNSKFNRAVGIMFPVIFGLLGVVLFFPAFRFINLFDALVRIGLGAGLIVFALVVLRKGEKGGGLIG